MASGELGEAYITLVLTDSYLVGALVLAHSLREVGSTKNLAVMIIPGLQQSTQDALRVHLRNPIFITREDNLQLLGRPDLRPAFTKLRVWQQTQFSKIVYIDADVVALRNPDDLFDLDCDFAAAPDSGWPDSFNSGVFLTKPSETTFHILNALAEAGVSFDGADQGLLNQHFTNWTRISFAYNVTPSGHYQYLPAYRHFAANVRLVHFIGLPKPWNTPRSIQTNSAYNELASRWFAIWEKNVQQICPNPSYPGVSKPVNSMNYPSAYHDMTAASTMGNQQTRGSYPSTFFNAVWDAQKSSPQSTIPEGPALEGARLSNKWDEPYDRKEATFIPPPVHLPPQNVRYTFPKFSEPIPRTIFPWETNQRPATRIFPGDEEHESSEFIIAEAEAVQRERELGYITSSERLGSYGVHNSWDNHASIKSYSDSIAERIDAAEPLVLNEHTEIIERVIPTLQTPDFPSAEGIPSPAEWDPETQLDELVKNRNLYLGDSDRREDFMGGKSRLSLSLRMPDERELVPQGLVSPTISYSETATEDRSPLTWTTETGFNPTPRPFEKEITGESFLVLTDEKMSRHIA
ncbi:Glycogenin-1 [Neolecta irregularis DAH-3]|uniref:glycogenin glucosyltransferase n=1 Tax=Neolecta irregularis (strain DAH-3) TaxID=1198029 RepID=A0A1U7LP82_NEOID|nr:Glycogenin-1 [Neolecta irregularis DAH-3]|eukprot:OLL24438.1 Glycogenin-1 [Neolecta irregularis DAH-3]